MKNLIVLSLLMIGMSTFALAQGEANGSSEPFKKPKKENKSYPLVKEVRFAFGDGDSISVPKRIKTGDFYRVRVDGINLNNYRVELQVKDTVYYSKALDFPVFGSIDISGLKGLVESFGAAEIKSIGDLHNKGRENVPKIIRKFLVDHQKNIEVEKEKINDQAERIDDERFEIMLLKIKAKSQVDETDLESFKFDSKIKAFEEIKLAIDGINKSYTQNFKEFSEFFKKHEVIDFFEGDIGPVTELKQEKEKTENAYAELNKSLSNTKSKVSTENVNKILTSVLHLYTNRTYTSLPIQFTGEEAEIKMSFIPKDSASNLQTYHLSPIKFGRSPWYWAVGPGMYFSRLQNDRVGFETIQVNDSTQNFRILEENPIGGEIGVSALFHGGRKFSLGELDLGIHLSVGTGISLGDEIQARMLYGGGLALGKKNHLTIDFGEARGFVNSLAKQVETNGFDFVYSEKPSALVKEMDNKFFISIGYMFTF